MIILMAALVAVSTRQPGELIAAAQVLFGDLFIMAYVLLILAAVVSRQRLVNCTAVQCEFWFEAGQQSAAGIATLALTFTLLGISLGVGSLSEQPMRADNAPEMIRVLAEQFSMAFMTSVVGLPTAALLRAWLSLTEKRLRHV
ncbi:hypothetical protein A9Q89_03745 [Gammaproteobacteria bacterium 53_120_T64]|nr:hypothetical protein A9Q89_03745 [Gammaproteobacteria bacterium 53_120_T64]